MKPVINILPVTTFTSISDSTLLLPHEIGYIKSFLPIFEFMMDSYYGYKDDNKLTIENLLFDNIKDRIITLINRAIFLINKDPIFNKYVWLEKVETLDYVIDIGIFDLDSYKKSKYFGLYCKLEYYLNDLNKDYSKLVDDEYMIDPEKDVIQLSFFHFTVIDRDKPFMILKPNEIQL